jgi:hypothetical protein
VTVGDRQLAIQQAKDDVRIRKAGRALAEAGHNLCRAREIQGAALDRAQRAAMEAVAAGFSEAEVARVVGVDRMTVRKWRGKR